MSSSFKTNHYSLNNWIGTDKPKREDFNYDNQQVDSALHGINTELTSHKGDTGAHLTEGERASWDGKIKVVSGVYYGDGKTNRAISLGFKPLFVLVFLKLGPFQSVDFNGRTTSVSCGIASAEGGTAGLTVYDGGFSVMQILDAATGVMPWLNEEGATYCYLAFSN